MKAIYIVCVIALLGAMMVAPAAATTWYVYDGESIQAAIDSASSGDTVFVYNGSYIGGFELNTPNITVKGEGADVVTIDVGGSNVNVNVNSPGCIIEGIKIVNIYLSKIMSPNCIVRNCIYDGVSGTITIDGSATNTTFENNVVTNGTFEYSVVYLKGDNSTVAKNSIINNKCTSETSSRAVCIKEASNCTVVNNTITGNNGDGIRLWKSSTANNIIKRNNISANTRCGIYLKDAGSGNRIYLNDIVDSPTSVIYYGVAPATIYWNSTEPIEYTYGGAIHTNYLGNCWGSDYTGGDGDGDGLGDVPYDITGSATDKDHRPLMEGFENYPALAGAADPDLTPTSIVNDSLSAGVPAAITVDISNIGSADAGQFNVSLKVEDTVIESDTVASLGAGSSVPVVFTWTPDAAGSFNLTAIVDSDDAVAESDEANNGLTKEVTVTPAAATTWYVHDGESIWDTINSATDGDTVFVYNGTYGVFAINKPNITLIGEGADVVTVDCGGTTSAIGNAASASGCVVDGFKIVNSDHGIEVYSSCPNCIIRNCVFESPSMMISLGAINTTFMGNVVSNSTYSSRALDITRNGSTIINNTIINSVGAAILPYIDAQGPNSVISGNNLISNGKGIWLHSSYVYPGYKIYLNNFVDNTENIKISGTLPLTYFNSTSPIEYTYNGSTYTGYLGNYWSEYGGVDTTPEDGIGDSAYQIATSTDYDYQPLMTGFENYPESHTPTPFLISGNVSYTSGGHVLDPTVTVTNLATGEQFTVKTTTGSSLYLTLTDSTHITAGDTIRINASDGTTSSETDHPVTASEITTGGFVQAMLLEAGDRPDLTVTGKSEDWVSLKDRTYNVTYTVENIGGDAAGASTTSITIDGVVGTNDSVPALQAGENYTGTVGPFTLSGENDTIEVCSDIANDVDEPDELNNCLENVLEFSDMPELTVTEITTPENIYADVNNVISATVANTGDADSGAFNVSFASGGSVVDLEAVTNIPAGNNTTVSFDWTPSGTGNHEICTIADCDLEVPEPDETNNELCENVDAVTPNPDMIIAKIALTTPGYANKNNTLEVAVTNAGVLDAGAFTVSFSVDGTALPVQTVTQLAAGATTELEYTWTPASTGAYTLYAEADTGNAVTELNESNNDFTRTSVIIKHTDWAQFHYDEVHTGFSPSGAPNTNETLWISDEISAIGGTSTVIADGMVFAYGGPTGWSGEDGVLYGLDEFTGAILWNISIPTPAYGSWSSPAYHNGRVFTSTGIETGCYNASTGEQIWTFENPTNEPSVNGGPVVADGKVIVNDWQAGHYYCLDEETGELLWTFAEGQTGSWAVGYAQGVAAYEDGKFYLTTWLYVGGNVYCVDADTGEEIWNQTTPLDICGSPAVVDGTVYVTNYDFYGDGEIYAMDANDGEILWQQTIQRTDSTPAVAYGNVYVTGGCKDYSSLQTYCFNAATGDLVWSTDAADEIGEFKISVAVADGKVFVGKAATFFEYAGTVALDAFTGDLVWSHPEGGSSPAVADNIVFTIGGGRVYAFYSEPQEPDLTVTAIGTPANLRNDVINPITATIENIGRSSAGNFDVLLTVDGMTIDTQPSPILAAGENTTVEFLWTPSSTGNQTLTVSADASDAVTESDESNNNLSQTVDVLDKLTVTANVRIEGKNETVWCGDVTFSNSTVTSSDGSIHYLNEPTALGALDCADKLGGFGYVVESHPTYGLYISEVNNEPPIGWDGWMYRVNYVSPWVGAAAYTLTDSDEVLWYFGAWTAPPLTIELSATEVSPGEEFVATVTTYNGTSGLFEPVDNATVYVDGLTFRTGIGGNATLSIDIAGDYLVYADKGTWAEYTRSEKVEVMVTIPAGVKFDLKKLNLNSNGILKAFITLPEGYDVADIDVSTVECEGAHTFGDGSVIPGKRALEVKFKIQDMVDVLIGDAVSLSVTGELTTGERFEGSNTVKVTAK